MKSTTYTIKKKCNNCSTINSKVNHTCSGCNLLLTEENEEDEKNEHRE